MIYLISIRNADPSVVLQEFPGMRGITCFLVFIEDDLTLRIHKTRPVNPHITLASGRPSIFIDEDRCLIRLYHVIIIEKIMEMVIHGTQILLTQADHPVCHVLPGNGKAIPLKFFFKTVKRHRIYIFSIYDRCCKRWGNKTAMKQVTWMRGFYHMFIQLTGIYADMVFLNLNTGRNKSVAP